MAYHVRRRRSDQTKPNQHQRALDLLAGCGPGGCTEAFMLANGIEVDVIVQIIVEGLAIVMPRPVGAGGEMLGVMTLRITETGRKALAA